MLSTWSILVGFGWTCFNSRVVSKEVLTGTEIPGGGGRGRLYLSLHCHHQNDSCIKMGDCTYRYTVTTRMTPALRWETVPIATLSPPESFRVQELCESRGGRPGLPVLMSLTVSVDIKQHWTVLRHWSQFVPNVSTDTKLYIIITITRTTPALRWETVPNATLSPPEWLLH